MLHQLSIANLLDSPGFEQYDYDTHLLVDVEAQVDDRAKMLALHLLVEHPSELRSCTHNEMFEVEVSGRCELEICPFVAVRTVSVQYAASDHDRLRS